MGEVSGTFSVMFWKTRDSHLLMAGDNTQKWWLSLIKNSAPEYGLQHPRNDRRANSELRM